MRLAVGNGCEKSVCSAGGRSVASDIARTAGSPFRVPRFRTAILTAAVWLSLVGAYAAFRTSDFFVWNDGPSVLHGSDRRCAPYMKAGSWQEAGNFNHRLRERFYEAPFPFLVSHTCEAFDLSELYASYERRADSPVWGPPPGQFEGYRPLSTLQCDFVHLLMRAEQPTLAHLAFIGAIQATLAVSFYLVARRFLAFKVSAAFAALLLMASPPCVAASWIIVAGIQAIVPLWICVSLLLYWQATEGRWGRVLSETALCGMMLCGPWVREFIGIVPLLVGCLELFRARRPTLLMGIAAVFFAHAVFPTALVKWLFIPEFPLVPVTRLGHLGSQVSASGSESALRWFAGWHFIALFPPTLLAIVGVSAFFTRPSRDGQARAWRHAAGNWLRLGTAMMWAIAGGVCIWVDAECLPIVLCLGVAVAGLQLDSFLVVWFLLSFLPFLKVFTEHVHFLYAMAPASIIVAGGLERCWQFATTMSAARASMMARLLWRARWAIPVVGALLASDQALTVYSSWQVVHSQYNGIQTVARHLRDCVPAASPVVGNVVHLDEIRGLAGSHFQAYYSIGAGISNPRREVDPERLTALLRKTNHAPVFLLDCDFERSSAKADYHGNKYVHRSKIALTDLGIIHATQVRYPFLDPLRHFLQAEHIPFLGPPDLVDDFYCGHGRQPSPFSLEMYAEYHLYRVDGDDVETYSPASIRYVETTQGFNVVSDGQFWIAIPEEDGEFHVSRLIRGEYSRPFVARSIDALHERLSEFWREMRIAPPAPERFPQPHLRFEGADGFNIVQFGNVFYGFPQSAGSFDGARAIAGGYDELAHGDSVESVQRQLETLKQAALERKDEPR